MTNRLWVFDALSHKRLYRSLSYSAQIQVGPHLLTKKNIFFRVYFFVGRTSTQINIQEVSNNDNFNLKKYSFIIVTIFISFCIVFTRLSLIFFANLLILLVLAHSTWVLFNTVFIFGNNSRNTSSETKSGELASQVLFLVTNCRDQWHQSLWPSVAVVKCFQTDG